MAVGGVDEAHDHAGAKRRRQGAQPAGPGHGHDGGRSGLPLPRGHRNRAHLRALHLGIAGRGVVPPINPRVEAPRGATVSGLGAPIYLFVAHGISVYRDHMDARLLSVLLRAASEASEVAQEASPGSRLALVARLAYVEAHLLIVLSQAPWWMRLPLVACACAVRVLRGLTRPSA
jgi:hypothetical protein